MRPRIANNNYTGVNLKFKDPPVINQENLSTNRNRTSLNSGTNRSSLGRTGGPPMTANIGMSHRSSYRSSNIEIDQDSSMASGLTSPAQDLTHGQVKVIHGQIKRDCVLLRNRVRMLKSEMQKANKKIEETHQKTIELRQIRVENDKKYMEKLRK